MISEQKNRIDWLDMVKGIGMILVIYSHVCTTFNLFNQWICSFFMPMFFICSGYCYSWKRDFLKRNLKKILLPYYLWGILGILLSVVRSVVKGSLIDNNLLERAWKLLVGISMDNYPLWFLVAFFVCKTVFDAICLIVSKWGCQQKKQQIVLGGLVCFIAAGGYLYSYLKRGGGHCVLRFDIGLAMLPFIWCGYLLKKFYLLKKHYLLA